MLYSIIVYALILFGTIFLLSKSVSNKRYFNTLTFLGLSFFSILVGCRWEVGADYISYYEFASGLYTYDFQIERLEIIPRYLAKLTSETSIPFYVWFIIMAFVQIYFVQKTFKKVYSPLLGWGIFFFITIYLSEQMNIVRQGAAVCICLYAYTFIKEKQLLKYVLLILFASCFHKIALICLPFYFLGYIKFSLSVSVQYIIFVVASITSSIIVGYLLDKFAFVATLIKFDSSMNVLKFNELQAKAGLGLGIIFNYIRYTILIFYYPQLSKKYAKYGFDFYYMLLFVYMCIYSACFTNILLQRVFLFFSYLNVIVLAFLYHYLYTQRKNDISFLLLIMLTIVQIMLYFYSGEPWEFIWNTHNYLDYK